MKTTLLLILSAFTAFAATTYPVLTDNAKRTFSGGGTNLALLNATNQVFTGTNTFNTNLIFGSSTLQTQLDGKPTVALTNLALINGTNVFTQTNSFSNAVTMTNSANNISAAAYGSAQQTASYSGGTNVVIDASKTLTLVTLTNTTHLSVTNITAGASFTVLLLQDSTGTRAVTFDTARWKFPSGSIPSVTTNANACDVLSSVADPFGTNAFTVHNARFQ